MADTVNDRLARLEDVVAGLIEKLAVRDPDGYVNPNPVKDESNG